MSSPISVSQSEPDPSSKHPPSQTAQPQLQQSLKPVEKTAGKRGRWIGMIVIVLLMIPAAVFGIPWINETLNTVSTDDAYVNGHVTFVAPRVAGQVSKVFVDDNNRVKKGDILVQLDKEPFQVQVEIAKSALEAARADLVQANAQARGIVGQMRSLRFSLQRAIEDADNQIAFLNLKIATLNSQKATLSKAQADFDRSKLLTASNAVSKEEFDQRKEALAVAQAKHEEALQGVYQVRVALGLPPKPLKGNDLSEVPSDLDQMLSSVRQAQASLMQAAAQLGLNESFNKPPRQMIEDFLKRDPEGDIDRIYAQLIKDAPAIKQAEARLMQSKRTLEQAELNLRYCDVIAEIDGVVTRRNVNPGNNIVIGQSLMTIRSLSEIWIDANFKETQLSHLQIGHAVDLDVDMYGSKKRFKGRITGFTMGTGSTLSLLPAENATGNFVKVVQRLPVRIELTDYDPDQTTLFIGLSVTPIVRIKETPTGPNAGKLLQPHSPMNANSAKPEK